MNQSKASGPYKDNLTPASPRTEGIVSSQEFEPEHRPSLAYRLSRRRLTLTDAEDHRAMRGPSLESLY
jgi:hypothetical protein